MLSADRLRNNATVVPGGDVRAGLSCRVHAFSATKRCHSPQSLQRARTPTSLPLPSTPNVHEVLRLRKKTVLRWCSSPEPTTWIIRFADVSVAALGRSTTSPLSETDTKWPLCARRQITSPSPTGLLLPPRLPAGWLTAAQMTKRCHSPLSAHLAHTRVPRPTSTSRPWKVRRKIPSP